MTDPRARAVLAWSPELAGYDFGPGHPMAPARLVLANDLMEAFDLPARMRCIEAPVASDAELHRVHDPQYVAAVREAQENGRPDPARGLGDGDTPVFGAVHDAAARVAGATLAIAREVVDGAATRGFSPAGGMHHAMATKAGGFCVYNDIALAIDALLEAGMRVMYVDLDAHHGDGVERAFWADDRVLTVSVHQHPDTLYPGTGFAQDLGGGAARGHAVNLPLPPGTGDAGWLRGLEAVVEPLAREFSPDVLVTQHGTDAHGEDPLAHLDVSVDAQRAAALFLAGLADEHAGGRWLATGGGGYEIASVVPRVWTHVAAVVAGDPIDPAAPVPAAWRARARELSGREAPTTMGDAGEGRTVVGAMADVRQFWQGFDPADEVDRAILATRQATFPWHGLDPVTA